MPGLKTSKTKQSNNRVFILIQQHVPEKLLVMSVGTLFIVLLLTDLKKVK